MYIGSLRQVLRRLVGACWAADPEARPAFPDIDGRLRGRRGTGNSGAAGDYHSKLILERRRRERSFIV